MAIKLIFTQPIGTWKHNRYQIDGPNPYTVGGEPFTAAQLGLSRILSANVQSSTTKATGLPAAALFAYLQPDRQNQGSNTIRIVFTTTIAGGTQAGAADLSAQQFYLDVFGT